MSPSNSLSFVTEQVAEHTNGTIGALLNATFGNAPELLIATAALRAGFYRVVQLAMLGSMLTNLLLVFGMACLVGGIRWQVQEIRITSGNVSVGMLLLSVTGSLLPAALILAGQLKIDQGEETPEEGLPTKEEIQFSRVNAIIMIFMYGCYLVFQLGTHKEEFDDDDNVVESADGHQLHLTPHFTSRHGRQQKARRNMFCLNFLNRLTRGQYSLAPVGSGAVEMSVRPHQSSSNLLSYNDDDDDNDNAGVIDPENLSNDSDEVGGKLLPQNRISRPSSEENGYFDEYNDLSVAGRSGTSDPDSPRRGRKGSKASVGSGTGPYSEPGRLVPLGLADPAEEPLRKLFRAHTTDYLTCTVTKALTCFIVPKKQHRLTIRSL